MLVNSSTVSEMRLTRRSGNQSSGHITWGLDGSANGLVGAKAEHNVEDGGAEKHVDVI